MFPFLSSQRSYLNSGSRFWSNVRFKMEADVKKNNGQLGPLGVKRNSISMLKNALKLKLKWVVARTRHSVLQGLRIIRVFS